MWRNVNSRSSGWFGSRAGASCRAGSRRSSSSSVWRTRLIWRRCSNLESLTNPRLRDEAGDIRLVPEEDRVSGPGTSVVMAAFTHLNPEGSRFSDGSYGVFYAARELETAVAETAFHRERFMRATDQSRMELDMRVYAVELDGRLHDLRGRAASFPLVYSRDSYGPAQELAKRLRDGGVRMASPTTAYAATGANVQPSSGQGSSRARGRSVICAMSGMASGSRPCTRRGSSRLEGGVPDWRNGRRRALPTAHQPKLAEVIRTR